MMKVNIQDAKTHLSRYIDQVEHGDVILLCRHNRPVAELRPIVETAGAAAVRPPRVPGLLKGRIGWKPGTFDPMTDEEVAEFEGAPLFPADPPGQP